MMMTTTTKPTRTNQKRKHSNPLSDARRSSNYFQDLWHKKSGLGFTLFVQYYGQQPMECCCAITVDAADDAANGTTTATITTPSSRSPTEHDVLMDDGGAEKDGISSSAVTAGGMSRAAKRRRKKKGTTTTTTTTSIMPPTILEENEQQSPSPSMAKMALSPSSTAAPSTTLSSSWSSSRSSLRLLQELEKHSSSYSHLSPFIQAMSKPLPVTFRLRNTRHYNDNDDNDEKTVASQLKALQEELQSLNNYCAPTSFDTSIYQTHASLQLHKSALGTSCPALKDVLVRASSQGLLARQELGSMLPVLGLHRGKHLKTNARVLDLCASPGSKTLQALEVVGPKGRVVANDVHPKRLETLQEAVQRSGMPHLDRILFTNHDASVFPKQLPGSSSSSTTTTTTTTKAQRPHVVVCDVPCSGDGTLRKDPTILPGWSPVAARALHDLQCRILRRALEVVQVGGVVSYSTCSLNPLENEAVIQTVLGLYPDDNNDNDDDNNNTEVVELLEWPEMEGLTLRPGVTDWKVLDYLQDVTEDDAHDLSNDDNAVEGQWKEFASYEEAKKAMVHCYPTLWPIHNNSKEKIELLKRCRRLWPQDQDTGGFFVALLRKKAELPKKKG